MLIIQCEHKKKERKFVRSKLWKLYLPAETLKLLPVAVYVEATPLI